MYDLAHSSPYLLKKNLELLVNNYWQKVGASTVVSSDKNIIPKVKAMVTLKF